MKRGLQIKFLSIAVALTGAFVVASPAAASPLVYHGGPVVRNPQVRVIFWGSNWNQNPGAREQIQGLFGSLSGSNYQGILTQYYDGGGSISANVGFDSWTDQSIAAPNNVSWANIENEIQYAIGQRGWPGGGINNVYIVLPAPGSKYQAGFQLGCASHYFASSIGSPMAYVGWPGDEDFKPCTSYDPGKQNRAWAAASVTASHEYAEAVTDPVTKKYLGTFNGVGWITEEKEDEIADKCIYMGGGMANGFYVNYLWDNSIEGCTLSHPPSQPPTPKPPIVQTTPATNIQEEQAMLNGTLNPNGSETTYHFDYGKTTAYGNRVPAGPDAGAGAGTQAMAMYLPVSLQPRTQYHYRLVATNAAGTSYGADHIFTTGVRWLIRNSNTGGNPEVGYWFGLPSERQVSGDWDGNGTTTGGSFNPTTGVWKLRNSNTTGKADLEFQYGGAIWTEPVVGDWNADGKTTVGVYAPSTGTWRLKNTNSAGNADLEFNFSLAAGAKVISGDWNGDNITTVGLYNPTGTFKLRATNATSSTSAEVAYGGAVWTEPVVGDWDNNKTTTIGVYDPVSGYWRLRNQNSAGNAEIELQYGGVGGGPNVYKPLSGDWDGDGDETVALAKVHSETVNEWMLRNQNTAGNPDVAFEFSTYGTKQVTGDWNGDGIDTAGSYDPATGSWKLRNSNTSGYGEVEFNFSLAAGSKPITGDWNGDGIDTVGLYNPTGTFKLRATNATSSTSTEVAYGGAIWTEPVVGDWDGNKTDTIGVFDPKAGVWRLRNQNTPGNAEIEAQFGGAIWTTPVVGDWNGDGKTTIGVFDSGGTNNVWFLRNSITAGNADIALQYGGGVWAPIVGDWNGDKIDTVGVSTR